MTSIDTAPSHRLKLAALLVLASGLAGCGDKARERRVEDSACERAQALLQKNLEELRKENAALNEELRRARSSLAFEHSTEGFGKTTWGMSRGQVRRAYPEADVQDPHTVILDREIDAHPMRTYFHFAGNRLTKVQLVPAANAFGVDGHEVIYQDLLKLLVRKYGPPREDDPRAARGSARLEKRWETDKTSISLLFIRSGLEPVLQLDYLSKELSYLHEQSAAERELEDL